MFTTGASCGSFIQSLLTNNTALHTQKSNTGAEDVHSKKLSNDVRNEIFKAGKRLIEDLFNKNKLYEIQKHVLQKMLDHINEGEDPNMLLDIATGFGKSFIQISFAGILESANEKLDDEKKDEKKIDYRIAVPDDLVLQLKKDVNVLFANPLAEKIKSKIVSHKEFLLTRWKDTENLPKLTFIMIDEIDAATREQAYREHALKLLKKHPCITLSATSEEWLHQYIKKIGGKIINISLQEKIKKMQMIPPHSKNFVAESIIRKTNKRSGFLPYACIAVTASALVLLTKIYSNSYSIQGFTYLLTLLNFCYFYLNIFVFNPVVALAACGVAWIFVIKPIYWIINKIAERDVTGRLMANLIDSNTTSPAHDDVRENEETFISNEKNYDCENVKHIVQSPRGKKALILTCNDDVIRNLDLIYRSEKGHIYKDGKFFNGSEIHDQYKLGRDFGEKYDFSFKESQRQWCIQKYIEAVKVKENHAFYQKSVAVDTSKVDFSDISAYSEYRVMHGIINSSLLALLQELRTNNGDKKKYEDVIALNKARVENSQELYADILGVLNSKVEFQDDIKSYLKKRGFEGELSAEMAEQMNCVIEVLNKHKDNEECLKTVINNWDLDKELHNMMKVGDEYQVLDDICDEFNRITNKALYDGDVIRIEAFYDSTIDCNTLYDNTPKGDLRKYLKKELGLDSGSFIDEMYGALKSRNYQDLATLFRENKLLEKINSKQDKFPLYKLRELCEKNKIIFNNLNNLYDSKTPFYGFDESGKPKLCEHTSDEVTKLFIEGWVGVLVDPEKTIGFSDVNLHNVSIIVGAKGDKFNPDDFFQGYGRERGLDSTLKGFVRIIVQRGVKLCLNVSDLMKKDSTQRLFRAREKYNKILLKKIGPEISKKIISYINNHNGEVDDIALSNFCYNTLVEKLNYVYRVIYNDECNKHFNDINHASEIDINKVNSYALDRTKEEFTSILKSVEKSFLNYGKNIKNQGKPGVLYAAPCYIANILVKALYYLWTALDYMLFSLRTIGKSKIEKGLASNEATYIHIIKNYTFESSIECKKIIETLLKLSEKKDELFDKLLKDQICKKALEKVISPLEDAHIATILKSIYSDDDDKDNEDKLKKIRSFINGSEKNNNYDAKEGRHVVEYILEISKEIEASLAWYHDSVDIIKVKEPKLKNEDPVFSIRNVGNARRFFCDDKEYRNNYGSIYRQAPIVVLKWFLLLVVLPQVPYLFIASVAWASAVSTIMCLPLLAFVFGYPEKFRSFIFNQQSTDCNELKLIANEEKIKIIEGKVPSIIKEKFSSKLENMKELAPEDSFLNPVEKVFV